MLLSVVLFCEVTVSSSAIIDNRSRGKVGDNKLDIHHIFHKAWCESKGIGPAQYNSVLNKTPISYKANRMIGGKAPSDYLLQIQKHPTVQLNDADMDTILSTHCLDTVSLRNNDYLTFIEERRSRLLAKITGAMGKAIIDSTGWDDDF